MRLTGRLESALESVLLADGYLREHLVSRHGFSIHRVRYAKDRRTVHILWDAAPGQAEVSISVCLGLYVCKLRVLRVEVLQNVCTVYIL